MRVQRQPTGPDRQGSRVSRVPPAKRPQPTGAGLGLTHRETQTFPVPRQVWSRAPRPPIAQGTARNGRARRHQPGALRHDAHQAKRQDGTVCHRRRLAVTFARTGAQQAGGQPAFQVTSRRHTARPNGRSQARHTNRWKLELELPRLLCSVLAAATGKVGTSVREAERDVRGRAHGRWRELKATCVRVELLGLPRCGTRARPAAGGPAAAA